MGQEMLTVLVGLASFKDSMTRATVRVWTDSRAAMGICQRTGLGKLRHIATQGLWIQHIRMP